ncbi:MAG TPA: Fis family transcriptional regulator, partial [Methylophaga sp.]|nr:Fis family transcriptional regulator [Methylophaga sp.]
MRKTDKKIDNELRLKLTDVCEQGLKNIAGFQWLTHLVNYDDYPN